MNVGGGELQERRVGSVKATANMFDAKPALKKASAGSHSEV